MTVENQFDTGVARLKSPSDCQKYIRNAERLGHPELAAQARQHMVNLQTGTHGPLKDVEADAVKATYAYEEVLRIKHGRKVTAGRTWQMFKRHGIVSTVAQQIVKPKESAGFTLLAEIGLIDHSFEALALRHPEYFDSEVLAISRARIADYVATIT